VGFGPYEARMCSLLRERADCKGRPFRGSERLPQASARDRACANRLFGTDSDRQSTRNCGPSGPGLADSLRLASAGQ
jgi:hypothetical protein